MLSNPARLLAVVAFAGLWTATAVNALWFQSGPHPSPLVQRLPWQAQEDGPHQAGRPHDVPAGPQYEPGLVRDIQAALAERGFYAGPVDGLYGPGTRAAAEHYQRLAGEPVGAEPSPALLASIQLSSIVAPPMPPAPLEQEQASLQSPVPPPSAEPFGEMPAAEPDPTVVHLQRVLAELGYAPGPIDGQWGSATSAALGRFEEDRGLPVTGEMSDRVLAELSRISGIELR